MKIAAEIFRAYDIRGVTPAPLSADAAYHLGRALAAEAGARGVRRIAAGRDGRLSSPALSAAVIAV